MRETSSDLLADDPRVRTSINTLLADFMSKYADESASADRYIFSKPNDWLKPWINVMKKTAEKMEALSEQELNDARAERSIDISRYPNVQVNVGKA